MPSCIRHLPINLSTCNRIARLAVDDLESCLLVSLHDGGTRKVQKRADIERIERPKNFLAWPNFLLAAPDRRELEVDE